MISVQCGPNSIVRHSTPVCRTGNGISRTRKGYVEKAKWQVARGKRNANDVRTATVAKVELEYARDDLC